MLRLYTSRVRSTAQDRARIAAFKQSRLAAAWLVCLQAQRRAAASLVCLHSAYRRQVRRCHPAFFTSGNAPSCLDNPLEAFLLCQSIDQRSPDLEVDEPPFPPSPGRSQAGEPP